MDFLNKMERKFGKYAIQNLPLLIICFYVIGYILWIFQPNMLNYLTLEPYYILRGEVWRIVSWVLIPPERLDVFTVIMLYFYFSLGKTLENTWGAFRFNVYILGGILFIILGAFALYMYFGGNSLFGGLFTTYYINMSIFLAFAACYPNVEILFMMVIPVKVKWVGTMFAAFIVYDFFEAPWIGRFVILISLLNFLVFFLSTRNYRRVAPKEIHRRQEFKRTVTKAQTVPKEGYRHKCTICGRTELDGEHLEFRYCSKCGGEHEYCQDHLFTHEHIRL